MVADTDGNNRAACNICGTTSSDTVHRDRLDEGKWLCNPCGPRQQRLMLKFQNKDTQPNLDDDLKQQQHH